ncbi:hypothetical protein [Pseudomonas fluorescens]|uniref:hypothetical protein n=1 Tax=Pseudomonas TaxID=286 RepID=UPI003D008EF4
MSSGGSVRRSSGPAFNEKADMGGALIELGKGLAQRVVEQLIEHVRQCRYCAQLLEHELDIFTMALFQNAGLFFEYQTVDDLTCQCECVVGT